MELEKQIMNHWEFSLLLEVDKVNNTGYNTGFSSVKITNDYGEPDSIEINGTYYQYKFVNSKIKDGWLNYYAITAYDQGDSDANLESLESSIYSNRVFVFPGTSAKLESEWTSSPACIQTLTRGKRFGMDMAVEVK